MRRVFGQKQKEPLADMGREESQTQGRAAAHTLWENWFGFPGGQHGLRARDGGLGVLRT